jgi:hypothetical protein
MGLSRKFIRDTNRRPKYVLDTRFSVIAGGVNRLLDPPDAPHGGRDAEISRSSSCRAFLGQPRGLARGFCGRAVAQLTEQTSDGHHAHRGGMRGLAAPRVANVPDRAHTMRSRDAGPRVFPEDGRSRWFLSPDPTEVKRKPGGGISPPPKPGRSSQKASTSRRISTHRPSRQTCGLGKTQPQ